MIPSKLKRIRIQVGNFEHFAVWLKQSGHWYNASPLLHPLRQLHEFSIIDLDNFGH